MSESRDKPRVAIAADHAGYRLKQVIVDDVCRLGCEVVDLGNESRDDEDDYPDFARLVAECMRAGEADRGIVICGSGAGVSVAASKFPGIRAAVCHDVYTAHQSVEHDDLNVLCLGARVIGRDLAREIVETFLQAKFSSGEPRHRRRLRKVRDIEREFMPGAD